jgi:hypothetical protein
VEDGGLVDGLDTRVSTSTTRRGRPSVTDLSGSGGGRRGTDGGSGGSAFADGGDDGMG